ncbi:hypothetical protein LSAT2_023737 [Lamellibrachia satsuma]|nr:hypothetical protein LSAT2_023737 [Lamellibrachia satsuma]
MAKITNVIKTATEQLRNILLKGDDCPTGPCGIMTCEGHQDGSYQNYYSCEKYDVCKDGQKTLVWCNQGRVWDDNAKACSYVSTTCEEPAPYC